MHDLGVLLTFAGGLAGALVLGFLAHRRKLSPIVGYPLAGVLVGSFTPGFVANRAIAEQFADIGVILLLFGIGLRFHLRELIAVCRWPWAPSSPGWPSAAPSLRPAPLLFSVLHATADGIARDGGRKERIGILLNLLRAWLRA